jgi:putative oxidoreductase
MNRPYSSFVTGPGAVGLLLVRIATGAAFLFHGWPKIQNATGWMGANADMPPWLQAAAAVSEFGGGIALILGLLTPLGALGIACVMVTAIAKIHLPNGHPFVAAKPGDPSFELAAVYLANALLLLSMGAGALSLDALIFGKKHQTVPAP